MENRYFSVNGLSIWDLGQGGYAVKGLTKTPVVGILSQTITWKDFVKKS